MAKPLGLVLRGGAYQLRVIIPKELQALYDGRKDFRISLGVVDKPTAQVMAHRLRAEKEAEFAAKRRTLKPQEITTVTPALVDAIGAQVYAMTLQQDDHARESSEVQQALKELASLSVPGAQLVLSGSPQGLSVVEAKSLEMLNASLEADAAISLARRYLRAVQPMAASAAARFGMALDWSSPGGKDVLRKALGEYRRGRADCSRRDVGELIPTPTEPAKNTSEGTLKTHTMGDIFDQWKTSGANPSAATVRKKKASLGFYVAFSKDAPIESLTKSMGLEFTAYLLNACGMQKTAKDHLDGVKSLLNFAQDKLGWLEVNPWESQSIQVKVRNQRKPWTSKELQQLFKSDLFLSYVLPETTAAGGAAAYWVPLLGLYTGARQSELCQIRTEDIVDTPEGLELHILSDGEDGAQGLPGTTLKTESSNRRLPIHSDLIALGFKDYWVDMKAKGHKVMFPDIRRVPNKSAGEYFSDWFLVYRRQQGITRRWIDFHAFRHTASTRLTDAGIPDSVADYLTGHSGTSRGSARRYKAMQEVRPALERLQYPELKLKRVYFPT